MSYHNPRHAPASPRPSTTTRWPKSAAPPRPASTTSAAPAPSARCRFDDLLFLGASISRYPLEGYREKCDTNVVLGTRFAKKPIELKIPITIAGMSFGALSARPRKRSAVAATHRAPRPRRVTAA
jgi:glutamate synthase domain-containing protein 2